MPAEPLDEIGASDDDAGLRAAEELVAREADQVGAGRKALPGRRLVGPRPTLQQTVTWLESARAEVVDEREVVARRQGGELAGRRLLGEADHAEVRLVDAEDGGGALADGTFVVRGARAVRRSDLDELRAGACEDVRNPEAVADLDQLAARDDHLAPLGQRRERQEHRRRRCC